MFHRFDGSNHLETVECKVDLVSFSSTIVNSGLLKCDYSGTQSSNILIWMQVASTEESDNLVTTLEDHCTIRSLFKPNFYKAASICIYLILMMLKLHVI